MLLFKKVSLEEATQAKRYIAKNFHETHGIVGVGTMKNEDGTGADLIVGTAEVSQIDAVSLLISNLITSGKIPAVTFKVIHTGRAVTYEKHSSPSPKV